MRSADELACNLARSRNGDDYRAWWDRIRGSSTYRDWFWNRIVPRRTDGACTAEVEQMFWHEAVPGNWSSIPALAGWDWPSGGYFTQTLWLQAIPGNWASGPAQSGWPWASGGYYTQTFWLRAVPDGWGPRTYTLGTLRDRPTTVTSSGRVRSRRTGVPRPFARPPLGSGLLPLLALAGGRPRELGLATAGERLALDERRLLHAGALAARDPRELARGTARPAASVATTTRRAGRGITASTSGSTPSRTTGSRSDRVGGWPWGSGGYYTQFFWWRAVPEDWAPGADQSIGGIPGQGHYAFWLYHFAAPRGFAWRSGWSVRGSRDASYYLFFLHEVFPSVHAEYAGLARLTSGHLEGAGTPAPVGLVRRLGLRRRRAHLRYGGERGAELSGRVAATRRGCRCDLLRRGRGRGGAPRGRHLGAVASRPSISATIPGRTSAPRASTSIRRADARSST
ncbi:MAG: hypothetical protein R3E53_19620 [Myxococcota bacterium]